MRKRWSFAIGVFLLAAGPAHATCADHGAWNSLLRATVDAQGFVDYDQVARRSGALDLYLARLAATDPAACAPAEAVAFWINAYNAHVFRAVLDRPGLRRISDDFALFDAPFDVAKRRLSLNDIEHRVLRSDRQKGGPIPGLSLTAFDPRLHFALVCGAVDCPRLRNAAYEAKGLEAQLREAAAEFANSARHVRLEDGRVVASSLLTWFADDFAALGGAGPYVARLTDARRRSDEKALDAALAALPKDTDFRYDWTLNSVRNKR